MRDIVAEGPEAERVVMTMSYTYKAAGQLEAISQASKQHGAMHQCRTAACPARDGGEACGTRRWLAGPNRRADTLLRRLQAYAAAAEKHPRDTDILAGLFKSYVRCGGAAARRSLQAGAPWAGACTGGICHL